MKKLHLLIYSIITAITLGLISLSGSALAGFYDVSSSHVNSDAINYVQEQEVVSGYPDGSYKPDNPINRAEFTKIVVGSQFSKSAIDGCNTKSLFSDVPDDAWFTKYVCVAKKEGIIGGYPDGTFKPSNYINFVEAAKIIVNAMAYTVGSDAVWYKPYVEKLDTKNAIPTTILALDKSITRGDMAEMMYRLMAKISDKDSMSFEGNSLVAPAGTTTTTSTGTIYVGKSNCSDNSTGVSKYKPLCTIQAGLNKIKAGETLMILNGVYKERVYVPNSGSKGNPIVIKGESRNGVILDAGCPSFPCPMKNVAGSFYYNEIDEYLLAGISIYNANNITLQGFTVRNAPTYGIEAMKTSGLTINEMNVQDAVRSLINVYDSFDLDITNNILNGAHLGKITKGGLLVNYTPEEAMTIVNTDGFEVAYNHLSDGMKEGIDAKVGSKNGKIHHNKVERHCAVGIYVNEASDIDVYENTISDIGFFKKDGKVQRCNDILSGTITTEVDEGEYDTQEGGYGYEVGTGIMLAVGDLGFGLDKGKLANVKVYKNMVKDVNVGCVNLWDELRENTLTQFGSLENVQIYNNTFYNCNLSNAEWGPGVIVDKSVEYAKIYNNIFSMTSDPPIEDEGMNTDISHNLFYQAGTAMGQSKIEANPLFVDAAKGDFKLKLGSPAIDAGKAVGLSYNGKATDIGAFEY